VIGLGVTDLGWPRPQAGSDRLAGLPFAPGDGRSPLPENGANGTGGQLTAQAVPLSVKAAGFPVLPVWVAWKPNPAEAPGAMAAL
jgi:hypothetical protein